MKLARQRFKIKIQHINNKMNDYQKRIKVMGVLKKNKIIPKADIFMLLTLQDRHLIYTNQEKAIILIKD